VSNRTSIEVDPSNPEMARAWDGEEGAYWAEHADRFDESVAGYQRRFLDAAAIEPADRVLDIGCGTGQTTRDAARLAPAGWALGVDLSSRMLTVASQRAEAESLTNVGFEQADAQIHPFEAGSFDVVISRTGAMFFGDPVAAFTNIGSALRPGGRLVLLTWRPLAENEWIREFVTALAAGRDLPSPAPGAPGPFSLADPDRIRRVLTGAGFIDIALAAVAAPMRFGDTVGDAHDFVLGVTAWMLNGLDVHDRRRALEALRATIARHHTQQGVVYDSAAWLVTARRP
jgi:SAM-dependent methyltransferase